jgi:mono/diheme cytochrome c family protein
VAWKPFPHAARPIVAPAPADKVAYGRYLVTSRLLCFDCHSADFKTNDALHPERSAGYLAGGNPMPDLSGKIVYTANLTPDLETGIGGWTEEQFRRTLVDGIRPDNRPLRYPMVPYRPLTDEEVAAIFAYLRSVPPVRNKVEPSEAYAAVTGDRGKQVYYAYGCNSCHGDSGLGQYDLRKGPAKYPTDEELIACLPGTASSRKTSTRRSPPTCAPSRRPLRRPGTAPSPDHYRSHASFRVNDPPWAVERRLAGLPRERFGGVGADPYCQTDDSSPCCTSCFSCSSIHCWKPSGVWIVT